MEQEKIEQTPEYAPKRFSVVKWWRATSLCSKISILRLMLVPLILFFYIMALEAHHSAFAGADFFHSYGRLVAFVLFVVAAGAGLMYVYLKRKHFQPTPADKLLDSICCRLLVLSAFVLLLADQLATYNEFVTFFPRWAAILVVFTALARDLIVSILRHMASLRGITLDYDRVGFWKAVFQMTALALFMLYFADYAMSNAIFPVGVALDILTYFAWFVMATATFLAILSAGFYIYRYNKELKEKQQGE